MRTALLTLSLTLHPWEGPPSETRNRGVDTWGICARESVKTGVIERPVCAPETLDRWEGPPSETRNSGGGMWGICLRKRRVQCKDAPYVHRSTDQGSNISSTRGLSPARVGRKLEDSIHRCWLSLLGPLTSCVPHGAPTGTRRRLGSAATPRLTSSRLAQQGGRKSKGAWRGWRTDHPLRPQRPTFTPPSPTRALWRQGEGG